MTDDAVAEFPPEGFRGHAERETRMLPMERIDPRAPAANRIAENGQGSSNAG